MTPIEELIRLALPCIKTRSNIQRAQLLETAGQILQGELGDACMAEAVCLRHAENHQSKIEELLKEEQP